MNRYKIVIVKHPNCNTPYTFSVPENINLSAGDYVLCDTKSHKYPQVGHCMTPSYFVEEDVLIGLLHISPENLRPVVAHMDLVWHREESNDAGNA